MTKRVSRVKTAVELRHEAQDEIMTAIQARYIAMDADADERARYRAQVLRIEKLFGYEVGSWTAEGDEE